VHQGAGLGQGTSKGEGALLLFGGCPYATVGSKAVHILRPRATPRGTLESGVGPRGQPPGAPLAAAWNGRFRHSPSPSPGTLPARHAACLGYSDTPADTLGYSGTPRDTSGYSDTSGGINSDNRDRGRGRALCAIGGGAFGLRVWVCFQPSTAAPIEAPTSTLPLGRCGRAC